MKKILIMAIAVTGIMYSCGGASADDHKKAANAVCECMTEKDAAREGKSEDAVAASITADYAACAMKALDMKVDPSSADFTTAIKENCANLATIQEAYSGK